jgi:outer membrane biosynthesis protein TonB
VAASEPSARSADFPDRRIPRSAVIGSIAIHVLAVAVLFRAPSSLEAVPLRTYRVRLVAAAAELAPRNQRPSPPKPTEMERRERRPEPTPRETPTTDAETKVEPEDEPVQPPAAAEESGDETVNVQLDGAVFAFPDYLENIVRQINRYWRRPTGGRHLRAEIVFVIHRDGGVSDIDWAQKSGDTAFDLEAQGAVEAAGRSQAFGPLPEGYPRDQLRVSFYFDPRN